MAERKLEIFALLEAISQKNMAYYNNLSEEERKAFQPFVVMRWLTGTYSKAQVYFLNAVVNSFVFDLGQHKLLLYQLLTICTSGKTQRYAWIKAPGTGAKAGKLTQTVVADYFGYGKRHAKDAAKLLSAEDVVGYAEELGWQKEEIAKLKQELKKDA